jgi:hypothetical protein
MNNELDEINSFLTYGIATQIFQAQRNLHIWEKIRDQAIEIKKRDTEVNHLFTFLQQSAQTNFVLHTAKLFDNPSTKYPTRCILSFLNLVDKINVYPEIENKSNCRELLVKYEVHEKIIEFLNHNDSVIFFKNYITYLISKYNSIEIKTQIEGIKHIRDKYVAHNEDMKDSSNLDLQIVKNLLRFATEILEVFGITIFNSDWSFNNALINGEVDRNSYFIDHTLMKFGIIKQ